MFGFIKLAINTSCADLAILSIFHVKIITELKSKNYVQSVETSKTDKLDFSAEHEEKMMRELKEEAEKLREENEDLRV